MKGRISIPARQLQCCSQSRRGISYDPVTHSLDLRFCSTMAEVKLSDCQTSKLIELIREHPCIWSDNITTVAAAAMMISSFSFSLRGWEAILMQMRSHGLSCESSPYVEWDCEGTGSKLQRVPRALRFGLQLVVDQMLQTLKKLQRVPSP